MHIRDMFLTPPPRLQRKYGFTLVELSIVLVVIGLLVGGILLGKDLIRQSEFRSALGDVQAIDTAFTAFKLKYGGYPGDLPNATDFFPGTPCNGDGNGRIYEFSNPVNYVACGQDVGTYEYHGVWVSLVSAQLLPAFKGGILGVFPGNTNYNKGRQGPIPASSIAPGGYNVKSMSSQGWVSPEIQYNLPPFNYVMVGKIINASNNSTQNGGILSVIDARTLDQKVDDGRARNGKVRGGATSGCVSGSAPYDWDTTDTSINCMLGFRLSAQ